MRIVTADGKKTVTLRCPGQKFCLAGICEKGFNFYKKTPAVIDEINGL